MRFACGLSCQLAGFRSLGDVAPRLARARDPLAIGERHVYLEACVAEAELLVRDRRRELFEATSAGGAVSRRRRLLREAEGALTRYRLSLAAVRVRRLNERGAA